MKTFLLVGHGGFYNRGCEAIVRCTNSLLQERFRDTHIILSSRSYQQDRRSEVARGMEVIPAMSWWVQGIYIRRLAGLCGSLIVGYNNAIAPPTNLEGLLPMVYCIGGGREMLLGPVIGALTLSGLPQLFGIPTGYEPIFFGAIFIFIITILPGGLVSIPSILRRRFGKKEDIIPPQWI